MQSTHVCNINDSSQTAIGIFRVNATGCIEPRSYPDYNPIVEDWVSAATGKTLYRHTHGLFVVDVWQGINDSILEWHEQPIIQPIQRFFNMFGGEEFCCLIGES